MVSKALFLALVLALTAGSQALERRGRSLLSITSPILGYEQNVLLQVDPPSNPGPNSICVLSGAPTPQGLSEPAVGPLFLDVAQGTGVHQVSFVYDATLFSLAGSIQPGNTNLSIDYTNPAYPVYALSSTNTAAGTFGLGSVVLYAGQDFLCSVQIQFTVYGGVQCSIPSAGGGGAVVIPPGPVYINPSYPTTIINQYTTVYNVQVNQNINVVSCTCCYNSCNVYQNITVINPAAPPAPPIDCTTNPDAASCKKDPPIPSPPVPPTTGPSAEPPRALPPTTATPPTATPPTATPPTSTRPTASPPTSTPPTSTPPNAAPPRAVPPTTATPPSNSQPPAQRATPPTYAQQPVSASG